MEETLNHQNGAQMGPQTANNKQTEDQDPKAQYSIPGILHFIQHEWARFELERSQWEVDRAELQARISFLQGERKGQENLKNDLVRRIKMLEYALKQERAKFHKLKYGVDLNQGDMKPPVMEDGSIGVDSQLDTDAPYSSVSNATWRQSRQLLRQYLQEIGYTDRIIDVRSTRVKALLGLNNNGDQDENINRGSVNGNESNKRANESYGRRTPAKKALPSSLPEAMMLDTEAAVMVNLDFLSNADVDMDDDDDMSGDDVDLDGGDDLDDGSDVKSSSGAAGGVSLGGSGSGGKSAKGGTITGNTGTGSRLDDVDAEAMEVLNELNLISEQENQKSKEGAGAGGTTTGGTGGTGGGDWGKIAEESVIEGWGCQGGSPNTKQRQLGLNEDDNIETTLGLGELAQLTVNNEAENSYDTASSKEAYRKTWNAKYTLRSHFDGVRALVFHPTEPVLITASEDHTLKLWNLQKTVPAKKSASLDVEPLYTFRCHQGSVLCLAMEGSGEHCYSGGLDGNIYCWKMPSANIDPYDPFEPDVMDTLLQGHRDAVWGLAWNEENQELVSCSADGTVKLWQPGYRATSVRTFTSEQDGTPCSVDFVRDVDNRIVAAYSSAHCVIFDKTSGKAVLRFECESNAVSNRQINRIVCHPTLPLTMTAHEDRHIRFWDNNTGYVVHSMVAHLDAVTSLAVDPNGLYLLSGSHDCSIRIWHVDNKTCVQEITAHRKKFDESILDVAFHPTRPFIASAGADGLAKVFV